MQRYPRTKLEMDQEQRSKFSGVTYVYPASTVSEMRTWFTDAVAQRLPTGQLLYWTWPQAATRLSGRKGLRAATGT